MKSILLALLLIALSSLVPARAQVPGSTTYYAKCDSALVDQGPWTPVGIQTYVAGQDTLYVSRMIDVCLIYYASLEYVAMLGDEDSTGARRWRVMNDTLRSMFDLVRTNPARLMQNGPWIVPVYDQIQSSRH